MVWALYFLRKETMETIEKICDTILETQSNFKAAQNIGIVILDKFGNNNENLVIKLRELAFYIQSLARGYQSQYDRAEEKYMREKS